MTVRFRPSLATVRRGIERKTKQIMDLRSSNQQIAVFLDTWVQRNFRSEGGNVGGWSPFKRGGRRIKGVGLDRSAKLLQDTGALRASFFPFWDGGQAGIGSDISYSKFHEEGTNHLPVRRMLPTEEDVVGDILRIYNRHVERVGRSPMW